MDYYCSTHKIFVLAQTTMPEAVLADRIAPLAVDVDKEEPDRSPSEFDQARLRNQSLPDVAFSLPSVNTSQRSFRDARQRAMQARQSAPIVVSLQSVASPLPFESMATRSTTSTTPSTLHTSTPITVPVESAPSREYVAATLPVESLPTDDSLIRPNGTIAYKILPGRDARDAAAIEQLAGALGSLPAPVSFDIASQKGQRMLMVRGKPGAVRAVISHLHAVYGQIKVEPLSLADDPLEITSGERVNANLYLFKPPFMPLKTWREFVEHDPFLALLGAFDQFAAGESALSQVILYGTAPTTWADEYLREYLWLKRRGMGVESPAPTEVIVRQGVLPLLIGVVLLGLLVWAIVSPAWLSIAAAILLGLPGIVAIMRLMRPRLSVAHALDIDLESKLREATLRVEIRLHATAPTHARALEMLNQLVSTYAIFNTTSANGFTLRRPDSRLPGQHHDEELWLSIKEFAGLWHMPVDSHFDRVERQLWERRTPDRLDSVSDQQGAYIGLCKKAEQEIPIYLSQWALNDNIVEIGKPRVGKTTLSSHVAARWMRDADRAVVLIDPHGDFAKVALGLVPPERAQDVIYLDFTSIERLPGLNLLDMTHETIWSDSVERLMNAFKTVFSDFWGPRLEEALRNALRALALANRRRVTNPASQFTIHAVASLLSANREARRYFLNAEVPFDEAPEIHHYFTQLDETPVNQVMEIVRPVLNKIGNFSRPRIKEIFGQPVSTFDLATAIKEHKIVIVNINNGVIGQDMADFIGSLLVNAMQYVIREQTNLPVSERVRVSMVIDEFQTITGVRFGAILGETAKNGGNFCIGTQALANLKSKDGENLTGKILAGVKTVVAFQSNGEDAHYLAQNEFDEEIEPSSIANIDSFNAYIKTIGPDRRRTSTFSVAINDLDPPQESVLLRIEQGLSAYTTSVESARRLANDSVNRFAREYGQASTAEVEALQNGLSPLPSGGVFTSRDAATPMAAVTGIFNSPPLSRREHLAPPTAARPKMAPPVGKVYDAEEKKREMQEKLKRLSAEE